MTSIESPRKSDHLKPAVLGKAAYDNIRIFATALYTMPPFKDAVAGTFFASLTNGRNDVVEFKPTGSELTVRVALRSSQVDSQTLLPKTEFLYVETRNRDGLLKRMTLRTKYLSPTDGGQISYESGEVTIIDGDKTLTNTSEALEQIPNVFTWF